MRYVAVVLVAVLLSPVALGGAVGSPAATDSSGAARPASPSLTISDAVASTDTTFESVEMIFLIQLTENGDARWTITTEYDLAGPIERSAFRRYANRYENGTVDGGPTVGVWRRAAARAANATGRPMQLTRVTRTGELEDQTTGVLRLSFRWTAFAEPVGEQNFRVHDVFLPNETWLPQLAADQVMFIEAPPDSGLVSSSYSFTDRTIRIEGPQRLSKKPIDMEYTLNQDTPTPTPTPTPTATPTPTETVSVTPTDATVTIVTTQPPGDNSSDAITFGAVVVAITVVVVALFARQGGLTGGTVVSEPDGDDSGATVAESTSETTAAVETATEETASETESTEDDTESTSDDEPDVELLSDEERVEYLLDENGGRMRQADIVSETGWSDAKVSQLLSAMAEEGRIDKLRLGRENLISFPDADDTPGGADEE